ncbi:MAG: PorV/PorQ family protein [Ignavibacteriae bacterium]|nr:MAG: PorV/PorQ family protein [Ignavibacteriota bacterium]
MKKIIKIMLLATAVCSMAVAQSMDEYGQGSTMDRAGQTSMNFLQIGASPAIAGRGNVYTAIGKGAQSIFGNPAGLSEMSSTYEAFVSSTQWFADIKYLAGAIAWNTEEYGVFGLHFLTVDYGSIKGAALTDPNVGTENYILTGDVKNVGAYSLGLSYTKQINPKFAMGGTVKYVAQQLGQLTNTDGSTIDNNQGKVAFDLGLRYYPWKSLSFAMTMRNFSTFVRYQSQSFSLPIVYNIGLGLDVMEVFAPSSAENTSVLLSTEYSHPNNHSARINSGLEATFSKMFIVRAGYESNHDLLSWSLGAGIVQNISDMNLEVDFSYSKVELFGGVNRLSLAVGF